MNSLSFWKKFPCYGLASPSRSQELKLPASLAARHGHVTYSPPVRSIHGDFGQNYGERCRGLPFLLVWRQQRHLALRLLVVVKLSSWSPAQICVRWGCTGKLCSLLSAAGSVSSWGKTLISLHLFICRAHLQNCCEIKWSDSGSGMQ